MKAQPQTIYALWDIDHANLLADWETADGARKHLRTWIEEPRYESLVQSCVLLLEPVDDDGEVLEIARAEGISAWVREGAA